MLSGEKIVLFERHCYFDSVCYRLKAIARSWGDGGAVGVNWLRASWEFNNPKIKQ